MYRRNPAESLRRGLVQGATLAALFAAASGVARAQDLSCDKGDVEVRSLQFEGNTAISDDELAQRVYTTPSAAFRRNLHVPLGAKRCLNRAYLRRDIAAIELYYLERGYYSAKADTVITRIGREAVRVTFRVEEGPVTILDSLTVSGLEGVEDGDAIVRALRVKQGKPFSIALYLADLDSITRRLRNEGYYRATTVQSFRREGLSAKVEIPVVPGRRARFGTPVIHVTPLNDRAQQVPDNVVRRVIGISAGSYFSDRAITEAQRALFQLGLYRHVEVTPLPDSLQPPGDSIVVLDVRLSEDYTRRVDSEFAWATLDCGRVRAQYADLNFLHSARRFELTGQASKIGYGRPLASEATRNACTFDRRSPLAQDSVFSDTLHYYVGALFRQPRLLGTKWIPTLSVYTERRGEFKAYLRTTQFGADVSGTRDIGDRTQLRVGYTREVGSTTAPDAVLCALFSRCDDVSRSRILQKATLGVASAAISRVKTDNIVSPTRGSVMRAEYRTSAAGFLGTSDSLFFHKASVEGVFYKTLFWGNVLSLRLRAGAVEGVRGSFIPPQERLYAGGTNSLRGFQQNELGDAVYIARAGDVITIGNTASPPIRYQIDSTRPVPYERVVPLGGNRLAVANLEYRVRDAIMFPNLLQYTFFIDAGNVWNQKRGIKPDIKYTPGIGLRLLTGIGTIQINAGYNGYPRQEGPIYFEDPNLAANPISPLYCVSHSNAIDLFLVSGVFQAPAGSPPCPRTYKPAQRARWYQRLAFTFSIGPDF